MMEGWADRAALRPVAWDDLAGWSEASPQPALDAFAASAAAIARGQPPLRAARDPLSALGDLGSVAAQALAQGFSEAARRFFTEYFEPFALGSGGESEGFLTGYYEPVLDGDVSRSALFSAPVLGLPADPTEPPRDRAAWEAFALTPDATPVMWLRDWTEVFLVQVQGSARVRLPDGSTSRLVYAGRNGAPYTSIGRRLIDSGRIGAEDMSLDVLKGWLRAHGQQLGGEARSLMQENRSYIFFRREHDDDPAAGPIGGQGLPLRAGVSIAVDRALWCYGLPFWITTSKPVPGFGPEPLRKLFIAQDTGSAIVGRARADLFLGSGEAAGEAAGRIRHEAGFTVLLPRA